MRCLGLCVLVLVAAPSAGASRDYDEALRSANQLRKQLEYERALEQAQRARKLAASRPERRDAAALTGVLLYELGRLPEARVAFREALTADPNAAAPANASPKLLEDFERERQAVKRRAAGKSSAPLGTKLDDEGDEPPPADAAPAPADAPVQAANPRAAAPAAAPVPAPVEAAAAPAGVSGARVAGFVALGLGLVLLGGGIFFEVDSAAAADALRRAGGTGPVLSLDEADRLRRRGQQSQLLGGIGLGAGLALVAAGAVLAIAAPGGGQVALAAGRDGAGLVWGGRF